MPLNAHRMKYFKCQVRLPYKLIVIFFVLCIARECQSIAYIGNLTKSRTFFIHNFYATDTFWKDYVQYNGDAIVLGVFFFYYRHKCLFLHSLTYKLHLALLDKTFCGLNVQKSLRTFNPCLRTCIVPTYHVVSFF